MSIRGWVNNSKKICRCDKVYCCTWYHCLHYNSPRLRLLLLKSSKQTGKKNYYKAWENFSFVWNHVLTHVRTFFFLFPRFARHSWLVRSIDRWRNQLFFTLPRGRVQNRRVGVCDLACDFPTDNFSPRKKMQNQFPGTTTQLQFIYYHSDNVSRSF